LLFLQLHVSISGTKHLLATVPETSPINKVLLHGIDNSLAKLFKPSKETAALIGRTWT